MRETSLVIQKMSNHNSRPWDIISYLIIELFISEKGTSYLIERLHSRDLQVCKVIGTKYSFSSLSEGPKATA